MCSKYSKLASKIFQKKPFASIALLRLPLENNTRTSNMHSRQAHRPAAHGPALARVRIRPRQRLALLLGGGGEPARAGVCKVVHGRGPVEAAPHLRRGRIQRDGGGTVRPGEILHIRALVGQKLSCHFLNSFFSDFQFSQKQIQKDSILNNLK